MWLQFWCVDIFYKIYQYIWFQIIENPILNSLNSNIEIAWRRFDWRRATFLSNYLHSASPPSGLTSLQIPVPSRSPITMSSRPTAMKPNAEMYQSQHHRYNTDGLVANSVTTPLFGCCTWGWEKQYNDLRKQPKYLYL